jgi:hypothetical protein
MQIDKFEDVKKACSDLHNVQLASEFLSCNLRTVCSLEGALGIKGRAEETAQERLTNLIQGLEKLVEQAGKRGEEMSILELEGLKSSLEKVLAVAVELRDGLHAHAPSEQKHALDELERCRALGWDGRGETDRLITATLTNPMAVSAAFLDTLLQGSLSIQHMTLIANHCESLLDKDLLEKLFKVASTEVDHSQQVTKIISAVGEIAQKKQITLEVENCLGKAFVKRDVLARSDKQIIGYVLSGLHPGHGTEFISGVLKHVAGMRAEYMWLKYNHHDRHFESHFDGEVFNGYAEVAAALPTLRQKGVTGIIDENVALGIVDALVGRGDITQLSLDCFTDDGARRFVGRAQDRARRAESPEAPPEEKPRIFRRGPFGIFGRVEIGGGP